MAENCFYLKDSFTFTECKDGYKLWDMDLSVYQKTEVIIHKEQLGWKATQVLKIRNVWSSLLVVSENYWLDNKYKGYNCRGVFHLFSKKQGNEGGEGVGKHFKHTSVAGRQDAHGEHHLS